MKAYWKSLLPMFVSLAASALFAGPAAAEATLLAEWLVAGAGIPNGVEKGIEIESTFRFADTKALGGEAAVLCSVIFDGTLFPNGEGLITLAVNLKDEAVAELEGLALLGVGPPSTDCVKLSVCAEGSAESPFEVWPSDLPWLILLVLEGTAFLILIFGPAYQVLCLVLGMNVEDECAVTETTLEVLNDPETGDAEIPAEARAEPRAHCTLSKEATGLITNDLLAFVLLTSLELLTVSSE